MSFTPNIVFKNKEVYDLIVKYQGEPPCNNCTVKANCFKIKTNDSLDEKSYSISLDGPCDEVKEWFLKCERKNKFFDYYMTKFDETFLDWRDIVKIIEIWRNPLIDNDAFEEEIGLPIIRIINIGKIINDINPKYCIQEYHKNDVDILKPIIYEALEMLNNVESDGD